MGTDLEIASRLNDMIAGIESPAPPLERLPENASRAQTRPPRDVRTMATRTAVAAAIVAALGLCALPLVAPGIAETVGARLTQLLQWTPPPPAPKSVASANGLSRSQSS